MIGINIKYILLHFIQFSKQMFLFIINIQKQPFEKVLLNRCS